MASARFHRPRGLLRAAALLLAVFALLVSGCSSAPAPAPAKPAAAPAAPAPAAPAPAAAPAAPAKAVPLTPEQLLADINKLPAAERQKALEEGAKKEGKIVVYGATNAEEAQKVFKVFTDKYPFVKPEFVRASTGDLLQRTLTEAQAGKLGADVLDFPAPELYVVQKEGVSGKYLSPERQGWNPAFMDKDGYWASNYVEVEVIGVNTKIVPKDQAPKSFEDLTDPKWKGKLGRTALGARWIAAMVAHYGEQKGMDLVRKIAAQNVLLKDSNTAAGTMLSSGEAPVVFDLHMSAIGREKSKGAPVDYVLTNPLFAHMNGLTYNKKTERPHATALYMDFTLSKDGQTAIATAGTRTGGRKDVTKYANPEIVNAPGIILYSPELVGKDYDKYQKLFEEIYVRGR